MRAAKTIEFLLQSVEAVFVGFADRDAAESIVAVSILQAAQKAGHEATQGLRRERAARSPDRNRGKIIDPSIYKGPDQIFSDDLEHIFLEGVERSEPGKSDHVCTHRMLARRKNGY